MSGLSAPDRLTRPLPAQPGRFPGRPGVSQGLGLTGALRRQFPSDSACSPADGTDVTGEGKRGNVLSRLLRAVQRGGLVSFPVSLVRARPLGTPPVCVTALAWLSESLPWLNALMLPP